jgi:hypothetical protein
MRPETVVRLGIGGVLLAATFIGWLRLPKDQRVYLTPFGIIGALFVLLAALPE